MPLDIRLLKQAGIQVREREPLVPQERDPDAPPVPEFAVQAIQKYRGNTEARRNAIRDKYAWGLASPLAGTRQEYLKRAVKFIKDPEDQQFLIGEVAKVSKAQEWARQERYKESGFFGDMAENAKIIGAGFADAGTRMQEAANDLAAIMAGQTRTPEEITFMRALQGAKGGENPAMPKDAGLVLKGFAGAAGMAPDMAAGLLSLISLSSGAAMAYWTARIFPERREDFIARGLDEDSATKMGLATSALEGAVELLIKDPTGLVSKQIAKQAAKKGIKKAVSFSARQLVEKTVDKAVNKLGSKQLRSLFKNPAVRDTVVEVISAGGRFLGETSEEIIQAAIHTGADALANKYRPDEVEAVTAGEAQRRILGAGKDAYPGIAVLGLIGMGGRMVSDKNDRRGIKVGDEMFAMANEGGVPSRTKWKEWGHSTEGFESKEERLDALNLAVSQMAIVEQRAAAVDGRKVSDEMWERWGRDPQDGLSPEQRLESLREEYLKNAEGAAPDIAGDEEVVEAVKSEVEADEAQEQPIPQPTAEQDAKTADTEAVTDKIVPEKSEIGQFVEDAAGRVGISPEALAVIGKAGKRFKDFFSNRDGLFEDAFIEKVNSDGKMQADRVQIGFTIKQFNNAADRVYGWKVPGTNLYRGGYDRMTQQETDLVNLVLNGQASPELLPQEMRQPVATMRRHIDSLSMQLIRIGAVQGKLAIKVLRGYGSYVTRNYRIFREGMDWVDKVTPEQVDQAIAIYKQEFPHLSDKKANDMIMAWLVETAESGSPISILNSTALGAKNVSILKKRKEIPEAIRALLGEEKDPLANYAESVARISQLAANHEFQSNVKQAGLDSGIFVEQPDIDTGQIHQIAKKGTESMAGLAGIYTDRDMASAFRDIYKKVDPGLLAKVYFQASGIMKAGKTIYSPMTHARNTIGNVGFMIANGHFNVAHVSKAWKTTMAGLWRMGDKEATEFYLDLVQRGIVSQDTDIGQLRDLHKDASGKSLEEFVNESEIRRGRKTRRALRKTQAAIVRSYQAEDDFWKVFGYLNEVDRYSKAKPQWSQEQVRRKAATNIRNTYPTYSLVPKGIKLLRRNPLVGTFPAFAAEVYRTGYGTLRLAAEELVDPDLRSVGAQRAVGMTLMAGAAPAVAATARFLSGVTKDEVERAKRSMMAWWQHNSEIAPISLSEDGELSYIDLSVTNPYAGFTDPIIAFWRGENILDGIIDAFMEVMRPFIGEEIAFKALRGAMDSYTRGEIDEIPEEVWNIIEPSLVGAVRKRIIPGFKGEQNESGIIYNPYAEISAQVSGFRIQTVGPGSLKFRLYDYKRARNAANHDLNDALKSPNHIPAGTIERLYFESEDTRRGVFQEISRTVQDVRALGVEYSKLITILDRSGVSRAEKAGMLIGLVPPRNVTKSQLASIRSEANEAEFPDRITELIDAMRKYETQLEEKKEERNE